MADKHIFPIDIPAEPLPQAVAELSAKTGLQVLYTGNQAFQRRSNAVNGKYPPKQALRLMLQGTGVTYRFVRPNAVTLEAPGQNSAAAGVIGAGTIPLDTIDVQGTNGGIVGYVASRSGTATKTDTPLIETPQSISVVTREQIVDQAAQHSVAEALRYTPGLTAEPRGNVDRYEFLFARGFSIPTYLDGLRVIGGHYAIPQADPYFLENVEAFRGPSSVLYGQSSPGGMVNLTSKLPTSTPFHELQFQAGNYGHLQGAFDLSGPIDKEGKFLYRISGIGLTSDTQVDYTKTQRLGIAPAFTWRPDGDTSLTVLGNYQHDPRGGYLDIGLPAQGTALPNPFGKIRTSFFTGDPDYSRFSRTQGSLGYKFDHRFNEIWTVRQNLRYQYTGSNYQDLFSRGLAADLQTLNRGTNPAVERLNTFAVDNQAQAQFSTGALRHTALVGLDYQRSSWHDVEGFTVAPAINILSPVYGLAIPNSPIILNQQQVQSQLGTYAQDQVRLGNFAFLLGGREDWAYSDTKNRLNGADTTKYDRAFTWRSGLVYLFDNGLAPYVSYSQSFLPTSGTDFSGRAFEPTTGEQYEAGLRYQPPGWNSYVSAAVFDLTQQNVLTTDLAHPTFSVQTGEVRSKGVELEGKASLTDGLSLVASYTYLDNAVTKANNATVGTHPAGIPRQSAALWSKYDFGSGFLQGLTLGAGVRFTGASFGDNANTFKTDSYTLVDALIRYDFSYLRPELKGVQLSINATNLLDKQYVSACYGTGSNCFYGTRRTILATLQYRW